MYAWFQRHIIPYIPESLVVNNGHHFFRVLKMLQRSSHCVYPDVLGGMKIRSPIGLASGWADSPGKMELIWELGAGFVTSKTITIRPRRGNPLPRLVRGKNGLINSMGLPNPGLHRWREMLEKHRLRFPWVQSISGFNEKEYITLISVLEPFVRVFELNFSCPNTEKGLPDIHSSIQLIKNIASVTSKPIFVKLSPANTAKGNVEIIRGVHEWVQGVSLINTIPVKHEKLGNPWKKGGLSGNVVYPILLDHLRAVREEFQPEDLEVIAMGGISTKKQVTELRERFAVKIAVMTAFLFYGPGIFQKLCFE